MKIKLKTFDLDRDILVHINYYKTGSRIPASRKMAREFLEDGAWSAIVRAGDDYDPPPSEQKRGWMWSPDRAEDWDPNPPNDGLDDDDLDDDDQEDGP